MPKYIVDGTTFDIVPQNKMTPGEIDAVERVTGMTFAKLRRVMQTCVCEHGMRDHTHKDDAGEITDEQSCTSCNCDRFEPDAPNRANWAFVWVSYKRVKPEAKFAEIEGTPLDDFDYIADEEEAGPTEPPHAEE